MQLSMITRHGGTPKMPGEPKRVQPSRDTDLKRENSDRLHTVAPPNLIGPDRATMCWGWLGIAALAQAH